ncbi:MAG: sigma-54-dependent Fis family transcriptional regulator [Gammaproteobacteria bacterium]|nr:sigma-54-dependent Fis family transcriptional regulator [Gammaproteobacteria bacterium]
MQTILVIDDAQGVRTALQVLFELHELRILSAASPAEGLSLLAREDIDLVIQDMNFTRDTTSGEEGVALFHRVRSGYPDIPIILLTAWTHLETAVELVKAGAADYLGKPWDNDRLLTSARNLLRLRAAERESRRLTEARRRAREKLAGQYDLRGIVFESDAMLQVISVATRVAHADVPVLITGANGAGKEKIADIVQANSACANGPYIKVNAGAFPPDLLEAELFGAEAGAFTGATKSRTGRFESADGGTLFLDEIGNLPPDGQVKLLRVLQSGEYERLGSSRPRRVRVRVIAATNSNLATAIGAGRFREDLYYRLNVIELELPPLAERREDILPLARHFLTAGFVLEPAAERLLLAYDWPGNVRELENTIRRAMLLAPDRRLGIAHLGIESKSSAGARGDDVPGSNEIQAALSRAGGIVAEAARELGLSRQALYRRMDRFGIR